MIDTFNIGGWGWVGSIPADLEFYTQGKYSQKQDKDNFRLTKTEKLLLPENPHWKKNKSSSLSRRKMIPDRNMEIQKKIKKSGKNKYVGKNQNV